MARIPLAPFEKILKESSKDIRVSEAGSRAFVKVIEEYSKSLAQDAAELARHANRKTILDSDIMLARKRIRD